MTEIILESISDGVFTIDENWRITSFNRSAERIIGIRRSVAIGRLCYEVFKSSMCGDECPLRQTMKSGKAIIDKRGFCVDAKGTRIPISVSTALLVDERGKRIGGAETFRDLRELEELKEKLKAGSGDKALESHSPIMAKIIDLIPAVASGGSTVLISGETGTGKELLARAIHSHSDRADGPFIAVNCGALPETLLESELFGYMKGAFTGADKNKAGRFKLAENGSLFLDELGDLPRSLQVKLLRVLQEREFEPLGSLKAVKTNARIICATNRDLEALIDKGEFRKDLYYRVNVIKLTLPPLRERKEDIPMLAERFLEMYKRYSRKDIIGFSSDVYAAFFAYPWPGNIRELENVVERAVVLCSDKEIDMSCLPENFSPRRFPETDNKGELEREAQANENPSDGKDAVKKGQGELKKNPTTDGGIRDWRKTAERQAIMAELERCGYQCSLTAYRLGIDKATLYRKIKAFGIDLKDIRKNG